MLRVTLELLPFSGGPRKVLGGVDIGNVEEHGREVCSYRAKISGGSSTKDGENPGPSEVMVRRYDRATPSVWTLVAEALRPFLRDAAASEKA